MSNKNLQYYIDKKHVRYMPDTVKQDLVAITPKCAGDAAERMFWVVNNLSDYPSCRACNVQLSSFHWEPYLKPELRVTVEMKQGYRPYCGRECSYKFGTKQESYKQTCRTRYGVDHPMKTELVVAKIKATNIDRYGNSAPNRWTGEKFLNTLYSKHGVTAVRHIAGVNEKIAASKAVQTLELLPKKIAKIEQLFEVRCTTDISEIRTQRIDEVELEWKHACGREWSSAITFRGIRSCPSCSSGTSKAEQAVAAFVLAFEPGMEARTKRVISPRELDIWIPDKKLAIEFDGTYWHSAKFQGKSQCMEKLEACEKQGIKLITLQEHLWVNKPELVKSRLASILGNTARVAARATQVHEIKMEYARAFLNENHIQGNAKSSIQLGLFYEGELTAVATFGKPRWSRKHDWELIRMASKCGITVQGGASKLISHFRKANAGSLISYADRCWSTGNVYKQLGFHFSHNAPHSYWWIHHSFGAYARYQTQKARLPRLLGDLKKEFYPELSEEDNMRMAGFLPLFDRGNSVWILE